MLHADRYIGDEAIEHVAVERAGHGLEVADGTHRPRVREDFMSGVRSGVNGTPTFYVNGVRHEGPADLQSMLWSIQHVRAA